MTRHPIRDLTTLTLLSGALVIAAAALAPEIETAARDAYVAERVLNNQHVVVTQQDLDAATREVREHRRR